MLIFPLAGVVLAAGGVILVQMGPAREPLVRPSASCAKKLRAEVTAST